MFEGAMVVPMSQNELPYDSEHTERITFKLAKLERMHRELASLYRAKTRDRRSIAALWYYIDGLELELRAGGVEP